MSLTVACVWVKGHVPYPVEYVKRLASMVARHLDRPYKFVCLTDGPDRVPSGVEPIHIKNPRPLDGWWSKVQLFNPKHGLTGRVLYLDLDTLVVKPLDPIVDFPASFALVPHSGRFNGRDGHAVVKRFNSSVMVFDAGVTHRLYEEWSPEVADRLHGDQDWIGEQYPEAWTMPLPWFPRVAEVGPEGRIPAEAKVVLVKTPKNILAAKKWPWFNREWRAA